MIAYLESLVLLQTIISGVGIRDAMALILTIIVKVELEASRRAVVTLVALLLPLLSLIKLSLPLLILQHSLSEAWSFTSCPTARLLWQIIMLLFIVFDLGRVVIQIVRAGGSWLKERVVSVSVTGMSCHLIFPTLAQLTV